jgi:predicted enzyme related to lactoylglutathione lyase
MINPDSRTIGRFCWLDLAASDAGRARSFYGDLFGWAARERRANGGVFISLSRDGAEVASLYQLSRAHLARGVPSHWTPYVRVEDVDAMTRRAVALGGQTVVQPFDVPAVARIALVLDSVGALVGLWESAGRGSAEDGHG